ncbi:hypothetical protein [Yinghuangia sp. YIM S09857]|uniref:hypothetical protein n=1 Tax=Yinghuangia sp. YIM S09857 TaxID=3436929 RepID=UPI003F5392E4
MIRRHSDLLRDLATRLPVEDAVGLLARLPAAERHRALAGGLPDWGELREAVVRWVAAHGDAASQLAAIGAVPQYRFSRRDFVVALADAADPGVRTAVYLHPEADPVLRRRMLTDGPYAHSVPDTLRKTLLATRSRHLLGPARDAADPAIARRAAGFVRGPRFQPPPRTPKAVHAWLTMAVPQRNDAGKRAGLPPRLGPRARRVRARLAASALELWTAADWQELAALHRERPLDAMTTSRLAGHPACPAHAALELLRYAPPAGFFEIATHAIVSGTLTWDDLRRHAVPADAVLRTFAAQSLTADRRAVLGTTETTKHLVEQVRSRVGDDPRRWWALLVLLRREFTGTIGELLDAAVALAAQPDNVACPAATEPAGSPWTFLLSLAAPESAVALVPAIAEILSTSAAATDGEPETPAAEMLRTWALQPMPAGVVDGFFATASVCQLVTLAQRFARLGALTDRLLRLDEPAVNAALLTSHHLPAHIRRRVLSGTSFATGRPGSLALDSSLTDTTRPLPGWHDSNIRVLTHNVTTIAEALRARRNLRVAYQLAGCRRLVELGHLELAASFTARTERAHGALPHPALAEALRRPLAVGDRGAALDALRTLADNLFRRFLTLPDPEELEAFLEVEDAPDWAVVAEEMRVRPLSPDILAVLAEHGHDIPDDLARLLLTTAPDRCAPHLAHRSTELARLALDITPLSQENSGRRFPAPWLAPCLEKGVLSAAEVVARGRPAGSVLRAFPAQVNPHLRADMDAAIRDLMARHGPFTVDALQVVAVLAEDFAGTFAELLDTAIAATAS